MIPEFEKLVIKMLEVHKSKSADYASTDDPLSNFKVQEYFSSLFKHDKDKVFASIIGIKIARLSTLLSKEETPNNESIEDTFLDACNYFALWYCSYIKNKPLFSNKYREGSSKGIIRPELIKQLPQNGLIHISKECYLFKETSDGISDNLTWITCPICMPPKTLEQVT